MRALLGDYPATRALRQDRVCSPVVPLEFVDAAVPNRFFKRVVRDLEFDVAELALMTFLMARSRGVPLRLLPVVLFSRNPLRGLVCHADRRVGPRELGGATIGVRAYTTTTAAWTRALLADEFGVDVERIRWLTCEEGHVAGVADPSNVHRDPAHADLVSLLFEGAADAIVVDPVPQDPRVTQVVDDPEAHWRNWRSRHPGADTVNHVVVVRESLAANASLMTELFRLFRESAEAAENTGSFALGYDVMRPSLEAAIAAADAQHLLERPLSIDDLVTPALASLTSGAVRQ